MTTLTLAHSPHFRQQSILGFDMDASADARNLAIDQLHSATAIYTAESVVDGLLDRLRWPEGSRRLLDASCGDGMFIGRALQRALARPGVSDSDLLATVEGFEIHPHACAQARSRVVEILVGAGRSFAVATDMARRMIHNRDFLTTGPTVPSWHCIVGNPPYLRKVNIPQLLREDYEQHVPAYAAGDMLHSFIDRLANTLHDGGEIAFVSSDRWLFGQGTARLRGTLGERRLSLRHVARLDVKSAFYRPKQRRAGSPPRIHPIAVVLSHGDGSPLTDEAVYPGVDASRYNGFPTLGDIATVKIAPWLGTPGVFVVTAEQARLGSLPDEVLVPAIDTDDFSSGVLGIPSRFAIRTEPGVQPCEEVMAHLELNRHRMAPRGRGGCVWLPPETFHRFDLHAPMLLVPRIAKTPRAYRVPPGHLPINHNISIVTGDAALLDRIEKALSSDLAADFMRDHAAPLENGYLSMTTTLLRRMPIC